MIFLHSTIQQAGHWSKLVCVTIGMPSLLFIFQIVRLALTAMTSVALECQRHTLKQLEKMI